MEDKQIKAIIDHVGRLVVGVEVEAPSSNLLGLENPVVIHVTPGQNNQLQVQSFPYIFMEFLTQKSRESNHWFFNKDNIVISNVELDDRIIAQYRGINTPPTPSAPQNEPEVIKLFDD